MPNGFNATVNALSQKLSVSGKHDIDDRTRLVFTRKGYEVMTIIGQGDYAKVYKALRKDNNEICAVKVIDLKLTSDRFEEKFLSRELVALMEVRHLNLIRIYDIFRASRKIFIFMEYAVNGDIARLLKFRKAPLSEDCARIFFTQVTKALNYLHEEMFTAHRDIKIENILLDDCWVAKLTDFGYCREAVDSYGNTVLCETFCGSLPYFCPKLLAKRAYNPFKADMWALGVSLYAMTHNRYPYHHRDIKLMAKEQMDANYLPSRFYENTSPLLQDLLLRLFDLNEERRISTVQTLTHKWVMVYD